MSLWQHCTQDYGGRLRLSYLRLKYPFTRRALKEDKARKCVRQRLALYHSKYILNTSRLTTAHTEYCTALEEHITGASLMSPKHQ